MSATDFLAVDRQKQLAALARAVPTSRMMDYGVPMGDATLVHNAISSDNSPAWDELCEGLARRHLDQARDASASGHRLTAAAEFRAASALLQCAQLAFNSDSPRKVALYAAAQSAMAEHAASCEGLSAARIQTGVGTLHAWVVQPATGVGSRAVIVLGGLSGWGASYLDMGRALAAQGMSGDMKN